MKLSFSFGPKQRVKRKAEFLRIQDEGRKLYSKHFLILVVEGLASLSKLGITITRKVDKRATARNRLRRRLREVFRLNSYRLKGIFDIVIIARKNATECSFSEIEREILGALYHHGLLRSKTLDRT